MFYENIKDVPKLITEKNILKTKEYLFKIRHKFTYETFMTNFKEILKSILIID